MIATGFEQTLCEFSKAKFSQLRIFVAVMEQNHKTWKNNKIVVNFKLFTSLKPRELIAR